MNQAAATKWMKLDNAAKIYPAAMSRGWMALFRVSATLDEPVDPAILQTALDDTLRRIPSFAQRLRQGFFWHYLEHISERLLIQKDVGNPCVRMNLKHNNGYMLRVRYHENRIAIEMFHVLADGSGALCFLKTLVARYIDLKYDEAIPRGGDILDCAHEPAPDESEDAFMRYARGMRRSRSEPAAYQIPGLPEDHFLHITTGVIDLTEALELAKSCKATLTEFLTAVLILAIDEIQTTYVPNRKKHMPIQIGIPVNLRKFYKTRTVRNFSSYINAGIEPKYGKYQLEDTIRHVHGLMAAELDEKLINAKFSTNVLSERNKAIRVVPLFIKRQMMKAIFELRGDRQTTTILSNLGSVHLPEPMQKHVRRVDCMLGPLKRNRVGCCCAGYNNQLILNFTRKIKEPHVERGFFRMLVRLGLHVTIESNQRWS